MSESATLSQALSKGAEIESAKYRYRVESVIGSGGFGITYKVIRLSDGLIFALKEYFPATMCQREKDDTLSFLKTNAVKFEEGVKNFFTEAQRLTNINLSHPNIISVKEVFEANKTAYYAMEYIEGVNLRQYIRKQHNKPLTAEQTLSVMRPILQAINLLHKEMLTHLDLKPDNIVLTVEEDGSLRPVIIDFGQSKHYDRKGNATSTLTNAGCSDGYSPQEQYLGLDKFTPQADVYALCATMLFLLTAKQPLKSSDISTSYIERALPAEIPSYLRNSLVNGLRKDKEDRTGSVERLAEELGLDITTQTQDGSVTRLLNIHRHRKFNFSKYILPAFGIAVVAAIVGSAVYWYSNRPQPTQSDLLTEAIAAKNIEELKRFAELDSPRAYYPYSAMFMWQDDFTNAIKYAEKALSTPDSLKARALIETAKRYIGEQQPQQLDDPKVSEVNLEDNQEDILISQENSNTPIETKDEKFLRAQRENDFTELLSLARSNYAKAYYPVALAYYNRGNHNNAEVWANKAIAANINKKEAKALIDKLHISQQEETPVIPEKKPLSDDELFAKATTIEELQALADKGYAKAFVPLAERYRLSKNYAKANTYAHKALSANISDIERQKAMLIIKILSINGAYDNGENGGEPKY